MRGSHTIPQPDIAGLRSRLQAGDVLFGTMAFEFHSFGLPAVIGATGADFVVLDLEATSLSLDRLGSILRAGRATAVTTIVRVPEVTKTHVGRCLDAGALGIMAPMVESAEDVSKLVSLAMYPPEGRRGAAFGISHDDYDGSDPNLSMAQANINLVTIAQIESVAGVEHALEIAENERTDVLWVGHNDLMNSLGIHNDRSHPLFAEAVDRVRDACLATGTALGGVASSPSEVQHLVENGYRCISVMSDVRLLQYALSAGITEGRKSAAMQE